MKKNEKEMVGVDNDIKRKKQLIKLKGKLKDKKILKKSSY